MRSEGMEIIGEGETLTDFFGIVTFYKQSDSSISGTKVRLTRPTHPDEVTLADGSLTRMEAGRVIEGKYYKADGTAINFTTGITGATSLDGAIGSLVAVVGITLASSASLLVF